MDLASKTELKVARKVSQHTALTLFVKQQQNTEDMIHDATEAMMDTVSTAMSKKADWVRVRENFKTQANLLLRVSVASLFQFRLIFSNPLFVSWLSHSTDPYQYAS